MQIIQAYKGKIELTQSQKDVLLAKAKELKSLGFTHMLVEAFEPPFAEDTLLQYIAFNGEYTERAIVGKRGGLSNGLGVNNKAGYAIELGNALELVIENIDQFENVITL
jgi:hypothetical protein